MAVVGKRDLAEIFGVSIPTVDSWVRRGVPVIVYGNKGRKWEFNTADVAKWREDEAVKGAAGNTQNADMDELKRRKLAAETTIAEVAAAREKGLVVDLEEVEKHLSNLFAEFRSRVRRVPERAVLRVIGEKNEAKVKEILLDEIDECLTLFSENTIDGK